MKHPAKIRVLEPFLTLIIVGAAVIYLVNALNTGNWLWFKKSSTIPRPSRIVIVDHGERTALTPGHPGFNELAGAAVASLSRLNNTDLVSIGLSEETLADYASDGLILELYFDQPVRFNSLARTGEPTQLLIPIEGRHADGNYVFRGGRGEWWFGALRMADATPLYSALQEAGFTAAILQPKG